MAEFSILLSESLEFSITGEDSEQEGVRVSSGRWRLRGALSAFCPDGENVEVDYAETRIEYRIDEGTTIRLDDVTVRFKQPASFGITFDQAREIAGNPEVLTERVQQLVSVQMDDLGDLEEVIEVIGDAVDAAGQAIPYPVTNYLLCIATKIVGTLLKEVIDCIRQGADTARSIWQCMKDKGIDIVWDIAWDAVKCLRRLVPLAV